MLDAPNGLGHPKLRDECKFEANAKTIPLPSGLFEIMKFENKIDFMLPLVIVMKDSSIFSFYFSCKTEWIIGAIPFVIYWFINHQFMNKYSELWIHHFRIWIQVPINSFRNNRRQFAVSNAFNIEIMRNCCWLEKKTCRCSRW